MADPFLGQVSIFAFAYAPKGWALCNGQLLPINQNQALFSLLGTSFGGNGVTTFALPNLQGRVPIHVGAGYNHGQNGGEQAHVLTSLEMPAHAHPAFAAPSNADTVIPTGAYLGAANNLYGPAANLTAMSPASVANSGTGQPHPNMQPYLTVSLCIALQGIFPSRN